MFDAKSLRAIICVHHSLAAETIGKALMISHVIFVRQKHRAHAAHASDFLDELRRKPRVITGDTQAWLSAALMSPLV